MPRHELDLIASFVAAELGLGPRQPSRGPRPGRYSSSGRLDVAALASQIVERIRIASPRSGGKRRSAGVSQMVSEIADEIVARLAPGQAREDLPMERIEI